MTAQRPYNQQTLNIRAAEFYKSIRKEKSKWKSVIDLSPMLAEFRHYIAAGDYEKAFYVYDSIHNHLLDLSEFQRVIAMGETLLSEKDSFLKLSEVIVMKIKAYLSWSQVNIAQFDIGEKMALEAKVTAETLFEKGPSSTDYDSANEFKTRISNTLILMYMFTGQAERALDVQKEYVEKYQNEESILYKASSSFMQGWMFQTLDHPESTETMMRSLKYFNELDETKMDAYHLNEKARGALHRSVEFAKKGQTKASFDAYNESCRINRILNDDFFSIVMPIYASVGIRHSYDFHEARRIADKGVSCSEKHEHKYALAKNIHHSGNLMRDKGVWSIFINKSEPNEGEEKPYKHQKKAFTLFQAAIDDFQRVAEIANTIGLVNDESIAYAKIGNVYCHLGHGDPALFILAEESLKKSLDLAQSDAAKYGVYLDLGRLYLFEASKIYKDSSGQRKEEAINKVNQADEHFTWVYEQAQNAKKKDAVAKAAYGLGVVALETVLVEELEGDDRKKKFDEAWNKFREACELFEKCESKVMEDKFLSGQAAEDFTKKYKEQPIDLRSRAEMQYGQAAALVGLSIYADEYTDEEDLKLARMWLTDKRNLLYDQAFKQVPKSLDFLRDAYRDLNMLRVSLDKEENEAQKVMDDSRKVVISTWLEKNEGIEEKHDETAELKWGFPISKKVIEKFLTDNN